MRALILGLVLVAAATAVLVMTGRSHDQLADQDIPRLIYLLLWMLLLGAGLWGMSQRRVASAKGPGAFLSLLIWAGVFALIVLLYRGAWFWSGMVHLIAGFLPPPR